MNTAGIKPGDLLHLNVRGYEFIARAASGVITEGERRGVRLEATLPNKREPYVPFVTPRQIVGRYRKMSGSR